MDPNDRSAGISRRRLLQSLAMAGAAAALPRAFAAPAPSSSPPRRLGVALAGLGGYSRDLLAPALQLTRHCRLAGIVTGSPHKVPEWQARHGIPDANVYGYDDLHRIADNPAIDVVYVVTPNHLHMPLTRTVANAGKHVWCEKPMAMDAAEGEAMVRACRDNRVRLAIGYRMQHEPNTRRFMAMAQERPFGRIVKLRADAGWFGWRQGADDAWRLDPARGGGAMYDMGVYCVNAARYGTGLEPVAVRAWDETARRDIFRGVDETMRFRLEFPGDIVAECVTSFGRNLNTLQVDCERGWYALSPFQAYDGNVGRASDGTVFPATLGEKPRMQAEQMDQDALAILGGTPLRAPGEEGVRDMRVLDAVFASARSGNVVVRIPD
ncbi:Gfo/Idh/MocA family protein [Coralloluteibacterium stylophorae]|uniref:Gfo/Idh/MocA family oxidoreductase n=1 Tax=Coralloluteibacterium stylophorae TaxID=1776034 RepID=A0A8J7VQF4_9GAMM|nr:Gfo/Idh/MocA family oxidoreductase [Coralloluteibacterium stylophorae]MBS7456865.1 Gfo/Idh/MocA family oxidoreductase [Coralloluteibacterium stylophorae]